MGFIGLISFLSSSVLVAGLVYAAPQEKPDRKALQQHVLRLQRHIQALKRKEEGLQLPWHQGKRHALRLKQHHLMAQLSAVSTACKALKQRLPESNTPTLNKPIHQVDSPFKIQNTQPPPEEAPFIPKISPEKVSP